MIIITREEAAQQNLPSYFTGNPCKHGHLSKRSTKTNACAECESVRRKKYYALNKDKVLAGITKWANDNKEQSNSYSTKYRDNNPAQVKKAISKYYRTHKESKLAYNKLWRLDNRDKILYYNADRRSKILKASVKWACTTTIKNIYEQAVLITDKTGVPHHVDHIIPLTSEVVCGLHCEYNLQILTASDNFAKHNSFDVN